MKKNKEEIKEYTRKYIYNKLQNDISFKLQSVLRNRLRVSLKGKGKYSSAVKDLGCSIEYFKNYLELKFRSNMTWENYGVAWNLDHIIPLSAFNLQDSIHFKASCNYRNLQPLWVQENLSKSDKYNEEDFLNYMDYFEDPNE